LLGLELQVGGAPRAGHDDGGADVAELTGDAARVLGLVLLAPRLTDGAGAEDDGVVGARAAGDVDLLDERLLAQPGADVAGAVDYAHEAGGDERGERLLEQR